MKTVFALATSMVVSTVAAKDYALISTFDGAARTTQKWHEVNDPVMGGQSSATFNVNDDLAIFNGTTRIVPSLKAPGFCNGETEGLQPFPDGSGFDNVFIVARTTTPEYAGFKLSIAGRTLEPQFKSYKANFNLTTSSTTDFEVVNIPIKSFSKDWSAFTGDCDTKDPTGVQHHCCSDEHPEVCADTKTFEKIEQIGLWSEGHAGDFHLEVKAIGVGTYAPAAVDN